ncbi:MAG: hypothetical protein ISS58_08425 [Dehalococcoidales bacterium]|nr:hypothetical protein [Dehalococcoidales bacterium]
MIIRTRIFELCDGRYCNLAEMAHAMGLSVSQVYRVREGKRSINQKFIVGAKKAFPNYRLEDLFYLADEWDNGLTIGTDVTSSYRSVGMRA